MIIAENLTLDGSTNTFQWPGGPMFIFAMGTFDGATLQLEAGQDGLGLLPLDGGKWVKDAYNKLDLPQIGSIRFTLSNAGPSTNVSVSISSYAKEDTGP